MQASLPKNTPNAEAWQALGSNLNQSSEPYESGSSIIHDGNLKIDLYN